MNPARLSRRDALRTAGAIGGAPAAMMADEKKLKVVVGLQRHYDQKYRETIQKIRERVAGEIVGRQVPWNGGSIRYRGREVGLSV